ncbi:hypothetical protein [Rhodanobacter sp. OK091]|nr:hypothetical protein [Rhodanobacter sp. OK091]SHM52276.1 hypothetical protein SAMN05428972_3898 [Rhodanobacter sp. OK091]
MGGHDAPTTLVGFSSSDVTATIKTLEGLKPEDEFETAAINMARHAK